MLAVPPRSSLRAAPLVAGAVKLVPLGGTDASELFLAVEGSRAFLEPWLPWVPFNTSPEASRRYADASAADWDSARACRFAIRERDGGRFLGIVGLESFAHLHESAELGYWLRADATGKGLMTAAGQCILQWAFGPLGAHRIRVAAATDNHPSLSVIRRLRFRFEGIAREAEQCHGRWLDHAVFGMLSTDAR